MLQLDRDARYADQIERGLYNGVLSGMTLDGKSFFYENPLADRGNHRRKPWFGCACCPSNISRLLASLGGYVASTTSFPGAGNVVLEQETRYPWEGRVRITVRPEKPARFELALRIPGWCRKWSITIDGIPIEPPVNRGYAVLDREWHGGEVIGIEFSMPVERIAAHPSVLMNRSQLALQRGPLIYCLEQADHPAGVFDLMLPKEAKLLLRFVPELLGGITVLEGTGEAPEKEIWEESLYQPWQDVSCTVVPVRAIPYYSWANLEPGAMTVWISNGM